MSSSTKSSYICVIGGANIDIVGFPHKKLLYKDANIGNVKISMGGVGRNIAENMVRLGINTKLITVLGDDIYGSYLQKHANKIGLDIRDSLFLKDRQSSVYLAIMDNDNDLALGLSAMDICEELTIDFISSKIDIIRKANCVILDTNISTDVLLWVCKNIPTQRYILDAVSVVKALRSIDLLPYLYAIKVNTIEAEALTNTEILEDNDFEIAANYFHAKGITQVFITRGSLGAYYSGKQSGFLLPSSDLEIINTNGAGDAFTAGIACSMLKSLDIEHAAKLAMNCSAMAVQHEDTVNPNINRIVNQKYE